MDTSEFKMRMLRVNQVEAPIKRSPFSYLNLGAVQWTEDISDDESDNRDEGDDDLLSPVVPLPTHTCQRDQSVYYLIGFFQGPKDQFTKVYCGAQVHRDLEPRDIRTGFQPRTSPC